jgi:hypothetical protein
VISRYHIFSTKKQRRKTKQKTATTKKNASKKKHSPKVTVPVAVLQIHQTRQTRPSCEAVGLRNPAQTEEGRHATATRHQIHQNLVAVQHLRGKRGEGKRKKERGRTFTVRNQGMHAKTYRNATFDWSCLIHYK